MSGKRLPCVSLFVEEGLRDWTEVAQLEVHVEIELLLSVHLRHNPRLHSLRWWKVLGTIFDWSVFSKDGWCGGDAGDEKALRGPCLLQ